MFSMSDNNNGLCMQELWPSGVHSHLCSRWLLPSLGQDRLIYQGPPRAPSHRFLPVVFANLDPARIPDMTGVDSLDPPSPAAKAVMMGFNAVHSLPFFIDAPLPVYHELWPRMWKWVQFLEVHQHYWHNYEGEAPFMMNLFRALSPLLLHNENLALMVHATPGVHAFVARFWTLLPVLHAGDHIIRLCYFLSCCGPKESCVEQFIEACEHNPNLLASLLVRHLDAAIIGCQSHQPEHPPATLVCRVDILSQFTWNMKSHGLASALLSAGLVPVYAAAIAPFASFRNPELGALSWSFVAGVLSLISSGPGYPHLPRALKAGLLQSLESYTENAPSQDQFPGPSALVGFLDGLLPRSMVYYPVVHALASALPKFLEMTGIRAFNASPAIGQWADFVELAQARVRDLEYFQSPEYIHRRACDNLECSVIQPAAEFKCCSACRRQYYCSRACQIVDWRRYGHRESCTRLALADASSLSSRDEAFLRLVLLRDYQAKKAAILGWQLEYMFENDGDTNFCTEFDYSGGQCTISVEAATPSMAYTRQRMDAAASPHSKLALHQVVVNNGQTDVTLPYILRSDSSMLSDGLQRIWESLDPVEDAAESRKS
ncbi:hypothetical protein C8F04DRAFT_1398398 [Mycena alexandri]|uniref:MYND-type domain-containing protein n=1 Tax=Mycena alexandri TaxID=1745969 RepID=A0AAD6SK28_9AGAR|nr:hypothetical protein C8F04DRAFT_1398398 [Mycena alexandri]